MIITKHAIKRFKERVTSASYESICTFIQEDINNSELLYSINGIEKRIYNGIIYIVDPSAKRQPVVVSLYLHYQ